MWVRATRAAETDHTTEYVQVARIERMWTHNKSKSTVIAFASGQTISFQEPIDYFIAKGGHDDYSDT